jgi:hypothetical protein
MVFTGAVRMSRTGLDRRRLLGAAAGLGLSTTGLAGCGLFDHDDATPATADALQPLLAGAVTLAAAYDRAVIAQPGLRGRLTSLAADHRAHAAELARVIGNAAPSAAAASGPAASDPAASDPAASDPAAVLAGLRAAEQAAQKTAVTVCKQAPAARAALAGSIAACRASHAEALR